jgi:hypothetical protein
MADKDTINYDTPIPKSETPLKGKKTTYADLYKPEYCEQAERLSAVGFTAKDLAYNFGVPEGAVKKWKEKFPEFKDACTAGRHFVLKKMVAKGLMEAVGYDYKSSKTRIIKDAKGNVQKIEETHFTNHQPANNNLLLFLVCNLSHQLGLNPEEAWQSKQKMEIESKNVSMEITGKVAADQIEKLAGKLIEAEDERKKIDSTVIDSES